MEHCIHSRRQIGELGHFIWDSSDSNLRLCADDALRNRWRRREEGASDFFRGQTANFAERQRDLRVGRKRRMAAREYQPQPVIVQCGRVLVALEGFIKTPGELGQRSVESRAPADRIDGFEATRRNEPCARIVRYAVARPALDGCCERIVQRFFGEIEVAEDVNERRENTPRVGLVDGIYRFTNLNRRVLARHPRYCCCRLKSTTGRISIVPMRAEGILEATWTASFRSLALMR